MVEVDKLIQIFISKRQRIKNSQNKFVKIKIWKIHTTSNFNSLRQITKIVVSKIAWYDEGKDLYQQSIIVSRDPHIYDKLIFQQNIKGNSMEKG